MLLALLVVFVAALLAIAPHDRADWAARERAPRVGGVAVLVATHRALPLSRVSYTLIFLFLCLHSIGAHYTYSRGALRRVVRGAHGPHAREPHGLGPQPLRPARALLPTASCSPTRCARCSCASPTCAASGATSCRSTSTMATSMIYELIEWGAARALRRRARRRLSRHAGRSLGRAEGHGARDASARCIAMLRHGRDQLALPARLRARVGRQPARQASRAARRGRAARRMRENE